MPYELTFYDKIIYNIYWSIRNRRSSGFNGAEPLNYSDIYYYFKVERPDLQEFMQELSRDILSCDDVFLGVVNETKKEKKKEKEKTKPKKFGR